MVENKQNPEKGEKKGKENKMKIIKTLRNSSGNSLAEFAVVIALMATLMSTGQVKFSQAGEGGKGKKTGQELDKIMKAANNFYNAMGDEEGAGRFPGQNKWDESVPATGAYTSLGQCLNDLVSNKFDSYVDAETNSSYGGSYGSHWCSVFGKSLVVNKKQSMHPSHRQKIATDDAEDGTEEQQDRTNPGAEDFAKYMEPIKSPFLDGHYIYTVIAGSVDRSPAIVVTDFYAASDEFSIAQP